MSSKRYSLTYDHNVLKSLLDNINKYWVNIYLICILYARYYLVWLKKKPLDSLNFFFVLMDVFVIYVWVFCQHLSSAAHVCSAGGSQEVLHPLEIHYSWMWADVWVLRIKPGFSWKSSQWSKSRWNVSSPWSKLLFPTSFFLEPKIRK